MRTLLSSKKGGIPAINELVLTFLNVTPRPILILIFLLLITTISAFLIPALLGLFGYECVYSPSGQIELYKIPIKNVAQVTITDIKNNVAELLGFESYEFPDDAFPNGDKTRLRIPTQCFVEQTINDTVFTGYTSVCTDCDKDIHLYNFLDGTNTICLSDGYKTFGGLLFIKWCSACSPPDLYYFNYTNCYNEDECYFTITNESLVSGLGEHYLDLEKYQRIIDLEGTKQKQTGSEIANIQCSEIDKPNLFFFNIEVFNRNLWIFIIICSALVTFAFTWYDVVLR